MTSPVASFIGRSSLIGLLALAGASVTADNAESLVADPVTISEPVVQVWGARTRGAKGIFGVHTWIAVKPQGATEYTVYEIIGWRLRWTDSALVVRNRAPNHWFGAEGELYAEKRGAGVDELIRRIEKAVHEYPYPARYHVWPGPNSNTFTAFVLRRVPELRVDLPPTAIGKDYLGWKSVGRTPSGTGGQASLFGLVGVSAGVEEGVEVNLLGLNFGVDPKSLSVKLPIVGRLGPSRDNTPIMVGPPVSGTGT